MTLDEALKEVNTALLYNRRMLTLLTNPLAVEAYHRLMRDPDNAEIFTKLYEAGDEIELRKWLMEQHKQKDDLNTMGIRQLKVIAQSYLISQYYRLNKEQLIQEIIYARKNREARKAAYRNEKANAGSGSGGEEVHEVGYQLRD